MANYFGLYFRLMSRALCLDSSWKVTNYLDSVRMIVLVGQGLGLSVHTMTANISDYIQHYLSY